MTLQTAVAPSPGDRFGARLVMVVAVSFLARLVVVLTIPTRPVSDFWAYFQRAENLFHSGRYDLSPGLPDAIQPPGYSLLLSLVFHLAPAGEHLIAAKIANAALGSLAVWIVGAWARRLWGNRAGLCAAAILSLFPRSLLMADLIASENLFSPMLLCFLAVATESWSRPRSSRLAVLAGLIVGLLALTRTVGYLLPLVWLAGRVAGRQRLREVVLELALLIAAEHAVLLPWAIRNARSVGRFTFLNTSGGVGLFAGNNPHATGEWYRWEPDLERLRPGILARSDTEIDDAARAEAVRWIGQNPVTAIRFYFRRLRLILRPDAIAADWAIYAKSIPPPKPPVPVLPGAHPLKNHHRAVNRTLRISTAILALAALGGFVLLFTHARQSRSPLDRALAVTLFAAVGYFPLVSALNVTSGRYRWPSEDVAIPVAALFALRVTSHHRRGHAKGSPEGLTGHDALVTMKCTPVGTPTDRAAGMRSSLRQTFCPGELVHLG